jgi:hypothetical protein
MGSINGPRSTTDIGADGAAVPLGARTASTNGDGSGSGCSGRTSGEGLVGDKYSLLSCRVVTVRALFDLVGAGENECESRLASSDESLSL